MVKKSRKVLSGSIEVVQDYKKPIEDEVTGEMKGESLELDGEPRQGVYTRSDEELLINKTLIEAAAKMIGKTAEMLTKIPEMDFDESEITQLQEVWSKLLPSMSPVLVAVVVTATIVAGKVAIYVAFRKRQLTSTSSLSTAKAGSESLVITAGGDKDAKVQKSGS